MTFVQWLTGCVTLLATGLPLLAAAQRLRRRLVPGLAALPSALATIVLFITLVVLLAEALGTIGLLLPVPLVLAANTVGFLVLRRVRVPRAGRRALARTLGSPVEIGVAGLAAAGAFAQTFLAVGARAHDGIYHYDSLHYHLTFAAEFAKTGFTSGIKPVGAGEAATYHPATAELLHSLGLVAWRVEVLTLVLNVGALALALLAAAALGGVVGRGAAAVTATAAVLTIPVIGREQGGTAANDVIAIAFVLAAAAFAVWAADEQRRACWVLSGLCLGLATGTKLTSAIPAALLVFAVAVTARSRVEVRRRLLLLLPAAVLAGGYWPLRNLLRVGNPFPAVDIGIGPFRLPRPPMPFLEILDQSVAHYLEDDVIVRDVFLPQLKDGLGPAVWVLLATLAVTAIVGLVTERRELLRLLPLVGITAVVGYLFTPTTAGGLEGQPILFASNLRYLGPALCLLAASSVLSPAARRLGVALPIGWLAIVLWTLSDEMSWVPGERLVGVAGALVALLVVAVAAVLCDRARGSSPLVVAGVATLLVVAAFPLARDYAEDDRFGHAEVPEERVVAFGRDVEGRTGISGHPLMYAFYGERLRADVDIIAERIGDEVRVPADCYVWRRLLREGRFDRVVVLRFPAVKGVRDDERWTETIPGVVPVLRTAGGSVFELPSTISDDGCAAAG